jgi:hypothetical protein
MTVHQIIYDRFLGSLCAACHAQGDMLDLYGRDRDGTLLPCPGPPPEVTPGRALPGTPPL